MKTGRLAIWPTAAAAVAVMMALSGMVIGWRRWRAPRSEQKSAQTDRNQLPPRPTTRASDAQPAADGVGPLVHRRYTMNLSRSTLNRETLMLAIQRNITALSPTVLARFRKSTGDRSRMREGDEYDITLAGPWDGRVRVTKVSANAFTLATLRGHPEAGEITFTVRDRSRRGRQRSIGVCIESWARARDAAVALTYDTLKVGKELQSEVWVTFLNRIAKLAGMNTAPTVRITTSRSDRSP